MLFNVKSQRFDLPNFTAGLFTPTIRATFIMTKKTALQSLTSVRDYIHELERNQAFARAAEDALDNNRPSDAHEQIECYNNAIGNLFKLINENLSNCREDIARLIKQDLTARAKRHQPLMRAIEHTGIVAVTLHDSNEENGFYYLDQIAPIPARLNTPTGALIGQSVRFLPATISEPRFHHIKKAITNAQAEFYSYTYEDEHFWRFNVAVAPLYGCEEVITIVTDAESWQRSYWESKKQYKI